MIESHTHPEQQLQRKGQLTPLYNALSETTEILTMQPYASGLKTKQNEPQVEDTADNQEN